MAEADISALQAVQNLDTSKYEPVPVYLTKDNDLYTGGNTGNIEAYKDIPALLRGAQRVVPVKEKGRFLLVPYPHKAFGMKPVELDVMLPVVHGTNVEDGALMGFLKTCTCDAYKLCALMERGDICAAAVAHTCSYAAHKLEYGIGYESLVRNASFNAFGNELLCPFLEISVR